MRWVAWVGLTMFLHCTWRSGLIHDMGMGLEAGRATKITGHE